MRLLRWRDVAQPKASAVVFFSSCLPRFRGHSNCLLPPALVSIFAVDINNKTAFTIAQEKNNAHIADAIRIRLNDLQAKKLMADAAGYHEKDDAGKDDRACASCSIS